MPEVPPSQRDAPDSLLGWIPRGREWVPTLRYLLRRDRILAALSSRAHCGSLLEIGCGAAALLVELSDRGYRCVGLEASGPALEIARQLVSDSGRDVRLLAAPECNWDARFDLLMAFDVLEHIEGDLAALRQWSNWLAPEGQMLLTVPAHQSRWGAGDVWAGHFRRYGRSELIEKLHAVGLRVESVECYGFPLANLTELLGERFYRKALKRRSPVGPSSRSEGNALSGVDRGAYRRAMPILSAAPGRLALRLGHWLQRLTLQTDWGSGFLVIARK